jgi:hypothetical protein
MRVLTLAIVALWMASVDAQSLGDVARKEAERRKTVAAPGKTYTNDQLRPEPPATPPPPSTAGPSAPAAPVAGAPAGSSAGAAAAGGGKAGPKAPAGAAPATQGAAPAAAANSEAEWRGRVQASKDALSRAQIFAEALQSRINGLSADFTARDDPAQRAVVGADRQKSLDELERVKKEIQQHTKALADIQEEGRRAGVPAGWLR